MTDTITFRRGALHGTFTMPGDKSISHRALVLGTAASQPLQLANLNEGLDVAATLHGLQTLGADIRRHGGDAFIRPAPLHGANAPIECHNSGSTARLLMGVCAGANLDARFDGDASLRARPIEPLAAQLRAFGARIETRDGKLPATLWGGGPPQTRHFILLAASAQVKSALLFCGVFSNSDISITGDRGSRDHTERMLRALGAGIDYDAAQCHVTPRPLRGGELRIPGDFSGAAFFIAGACIAAGSNILLRDIGINPTRTGFLDILARMGAHITVSNRREWNGEPVADLRVESASLHGTDVAADLARRAIDEIVVLGAVAAFARGVTTISGIGDLRHKESDRLAAISRLLGCAGARVHSAGNGIAIHPGSTGRQKWNLASHGDHRTVMAAAALAAGAGDVTTDGAAAPAVSFPHFATEWTRAQR